jgi:monoterpene epsilon-lactone hydrolase
MSWQSALACWYLRRQFRPQTLKGINVEKARALTAKRAWSPRVPGGWRLRELYGAGDWPLRGEWIERADGISTSGNGPTVLYCHGGGYYFCSPLTHRSLVFGLATRANAAIFSLDYRLAPEHRFPAALDDAAAAYRQLVANGTPPESIVIAGDSAGGRLPAVLAVDRSGRYRRHHPHQRRSRSHVQRSRYWARRQGLSRRNARDASVRFAALCRPGRLAAALHHGGQHGGIA